MAQPKGTKRTKPYVHNLSPRICMFDNCGNEFVPMNANQHYCKCDHFRTCPICGKSFKVKNLVTPAETCSKSCGHKLAASRRDYGEGWQQKVRATNMLHRGVPYPTQSQEVLQKRIESYIAHLGVDHPMRCDAVKHKCAATLNANLKSAGRYGRAVSSFNRKFAEHFIRYGIPIEYEFPLGRYRYDLHVVDTNVLIEIDPTVTHNSYKDPWGSCVAPEYHHNKSQYAYDNGYVCIHVFDWDDIIELIHHLQYSRYFEISESDVKCHWYDDVKKIHICDTACSDESMLAAGYLPVYDDGYKINFIYKEVI